MSKNKKKKTEHSTAAWMGEVLRRVEKEYEAQPAATKKYFPAPPKISENLPANYQNKKSKKKNK